MSGQMKEFRLRLKEKRVMRASVMVIGSDSYALGMR